MFFKNCIARVSSKNEVRYCKVHSLESSTPIIAADVKRIKKQNKLNSDATTIAPYLIIVFLFLKSL